MSHLIQQPCKQRVNKLYQLVPVHGLTTWRGKELIPLELMHDVGIPRGITAGCYNTTVRSKQNLKQPERLTMQRVPGLLMSCELDCKHAHGVEPQWEHSSDRPEWSHKHIAKATWVKPDWHACKGIPWKCFCDNPSTPAGTMSPTIQHLPRPMKNKN